MGQSLSFDHDPSLRQSLPQFGAGQMLATLQRPGDDLIAASVERVVEAKLAIIVGYRASDTRRGQLQQPANIGGGDEMPGWAQYMGAQNRTLGEGALDHTVGRVAIHAHAERPDRPQIFLRLNGRSEERR